MSVGSVLAGLVARGRLGRSSLPWPHLAAALTPHPALGSSPPPSVYAGFDPTAPSLHVGHLPLLWTLRDLSAVGVPTFLLIGGATALIGDPTGRSVERPLLASPLVTSNESALQTQLRALLGDSSNITVVNNADTYSRMSVVEYLREVGRHVRVASMLAKDSVRSRLAAPVGLSFAEFSYQTLQAYDYWLLHKTHNCVLQLGGDDQWGNITAGIEFCRRMSASEAHASPAPCNSGNNSSASTTTTSSSAGAGAGDDTGTEGSGEEESVGSSAHGATVPVVTSRDGKKLGKSTGNAIWLDATLTSHLDFYQYLFNQHDDDASKLVRLLTDLPLEVVVEVESEHARQPERKALQMALADNVTRAVRGEEGVASARRSSAFLFPLAEAWASSSSTSGTSGSGSEHTSGGSGSDASKTLQASDIDSLVASGYLEAVQAPAASVIGESVLVAPILAHLCLSKSEARRLVSSGGLYVNRVRVTDAASRIEVTHLLGGKYLVVASGKRSPKVIALT